MIIETLNDFFSAVFSGASLLVQQITQGIVNSVKLVFDKFLDVLISFLDGLSAPFGFKLSEVLSSFADFCVGMFNFFVEFFLLIPTPFNSLFFLAFLFLFCLLIYKLIRG